jgi:hypothetical protein
LIEIVFGNGIQHPKPHAEGARPSFRVPRLWRGYGAGGIDEERDRFGGGNEVVQELQSFFGQIIQDHPNPGDVSAGLVEASAEAEF